MRGPLVADMYCYGSAMRLRPTNRYTAFRFVCAVIVHNGRNRAAC